MGRSLVRYGLLAGLLCFLLTGSAFAQLEGRLYVGKNQYLVGEPVYLNFELTNSGKEPLQVAVGNSYSFCGGYQIEVSSSPSPVNSSCASGFAGSCIGGKWAIAPEETRHDQSATELWARLIAIWHLRHQGKSDPELRPRH